MLIKFYSSSDERVVFEVVHHSNPVQKEFLIVDFMTDNQELRHKKELVAEMLCHIAEAGKLTTWLDLDNDIARIMRSKVHII